MLVDIAQGTKNGEDLRLLENTSAYSGQITQILTELAVRHTCLWKNGRTLRVKFLGGSLETKERIIHIAKEWEQYANIKFELVREGKAEVRISFASDGCWSMIGTDALLVAPSAATMNFNLNYLTMDEANFRATVLHEFGHCLGCVHEHQRLDAAIRWNTAYIYQRLFQDFGWTRERVDHNFFSQLSSQEQSNSTYDPQSIMHYFFPPEFTLNQLQMPHNKELSAHDKDFISQCYPFPAKPSRILLRG
jgi:hypothetical protein